MTDHANAELIADARQLIRHSSVSVPEHANMLGRLADALEAAEQRAADALREHDALREVKAEAWDEGHDAGWEDRHQDALAGWMTSGPHESEAVNPYREEQDRD